MKGWVVQSTGGGNEYRLYVKERELMFCPWLHVDGSDEIIARRTNPAVLQLYQLIREIEIPNEFVEFADKLAEHHKNTEEEFDQIRIEYNGVPRLSEVFKSVSDLAELQHEDLEMSGLGKEECADMALRMSAFMQEHIK